MLKLVLLAIACTPKQVNVRPATPHEQLWAMQVLIAHGARLGNCLGDRELHDRSGILSSLFTIEPDGTVSAVQIVADTIGSSSLRNCSYEAYRSIRYPARSGSAAIRVEHRLIAGAVEFGRSVPSP